MSDQAILSFRLSGVEFDTYVHEADGLGPRIQAWIHGTTPPAARVHLGGLRIIDPATIPTDDEQIALMGWADLEVASGSLTEWYCLLRGIQGDVDEMIRAGALLLTDPSCRPLARWRFLLDLDVPSLEVWHRPMWDGGPVAEFERVGSYGWAEAPGVDLDILAEAVLLLGEK